MLAETVADTDGQTLGILKYKMYASIEELLGRVADTDTDVVGCTVDPLEHVLRGFRESLLQQAAAALVTPPGANDTNTSRDDFSTDDQ